MRKSTVLVRFILGFFSLAFVSSASATVAVTTGSGGTHISADKTANATSPAYTTLGNIVISEGTNSDFATSVTQLVLNAPTGWTFNTSGVTATVTDGPCGQNVMVGTITYTTTTITLPLTISQTNKTDILTTLGVQVRATEGAAIPSSGNIPPTFTGTITGLTTPTNLGSLSQTTSAMTKLVVRLPSQTFTDGSTAAGSGNSGSVTVQTVGTSFNISILTATDQFFNIVTNHSGTMRGRRR
jgi:hypothetical protein